MKQKIINQINNLRAQVRSIPFKLYAQGAGYSIELRIRRMERLLKDRYNVSGDELR